MINLIGNVLQLERECLISFTSSETAGAQHVGYKVKIKIIKEVTFLLICLCIVENNLYFKIVLLQNLKIT